MGLDDINVDLGGMDVDIDMNFDMGGRSIVTSNKNRIPTAPLDGWGGADGGLELDIRRSSEVSCWRSFSYPS